MARGSNEGEQRGQRVGSSRAVQRTVEEHRERGRTTMSLLPELISVAQPFEMLVDAF